MNQLDTKMLKQGLFLTAVSYALSRLLIGNLLFTIPLMVLAPKFSNRREALFPVGLVAALLVITEFVRARGSLGSPEGRLLLVVGMFIPIVLLVACAVWIALDDKRTLYRYLASSLFGIVASVVVVVWFTRPNEALQKVDSAMFETFRTLLGGTNGGTQTSIEASGVALESLYRTSVMAIGAMLAPLCMVLVGFTSFVAMSYQARFDGSFNVRVSHWRVPEVTLWVFLGSWALVLLLILAKTPYLYRALALQAALASSVLYAVQGMAIVVHFILRKGIAVNTTRLFATMFLLVFLIPGVNVLVVFVLPLLGVTETWIMYRRNE
ncbi:DUF115 domain-containing protein [Sphaerochaeta halotolerans]|jgi:hypothetical protein|uniref:DUF115 domain-containing protein n=1 Tax=Sphaerochaeta halotolerans TaxID=2293840 RepID=A0A372MEH1_9SPIR|nr:DUF115 domain-containing protein [Sphaerochaeta halotolerans]MBG0767072.1 DUF115 domain-containing protein [Spirochaetaceae bacterium]MDK2858907.1 hypothetical protein [Sphaerochaeta sp.]MDN5332931.1 hypothetical protein [Sphaerochaeta sp.]MXI87438.1 DUF115 domain-containing protein [Sphaerochaeta halotolerans]RFU94187.1 DUF115 domain-containing protein [Sphaerochaeta halotolerans]